MFDKLTAYKETLYEALKETLKGKGNEQIFFHYNNPQVFRTLIEKAVGEYSAYVIMPVADKNALEVMDLLPRNKVFILDHGRNLVKNDYPYVCQDFERDIYRILRQNETLVRKYKRFILVTRSTKLHFKEIIIGFRDFCKQFPIDYKVINQIDDMEMQTGDAYVVIDDRDLVAIVRQAQTKNLELGKTLGIISYNEIPLKEIIAGGITTISTDFAIMGQTMASMILTGKRINPIILL
ncbi:MAG: substrate-binding domain-containing protein [Bacteroidales bacterium]|nr:substrate-binding domain-containing protein [Bacteroidales bacterium]